MPILVSKTTDETKVKMSQARKLDVLKPWATDIDMATGAITFDAAQMTTLKSEILGAFDDNDAILAANNFDVRKAVVAGFIPVEVYADGMPNYHDVRRLLGLYGSTLAIRTNAGRVPKVVFQEVFRDLSKTSELKTATPKRTTS